MVKLFIPKIYTGFANKLFILMTALNYKKKYGADLYAFQEDYYPPFEPFFTPIPLPYNNVPGNNVINFDKLGKLVEQDKDFTMIEYCQDYNLIDEELCKIILKCPNKIKEVITSLYGEDLKDRICIHVRRGDYLSEIYCNKFRSYSDLELFEIMNTYYPGKKFICISDDIEWCKEVLGNRGYDIIFADKVDNFLIDFYIQILTSGNICSASSFSIMGAILNPSNNCVVPYPYYKDGDSPIVPPYAKRFKL